MHDVEGLLGARNTMAIGVVAVALVAAAWPSAPPRRADCPHPYELASKDGWTSAVGCRPVPGSPALRGPPRLLFCMTLDVNNASPSALESLPGVGPARAQAIVSTREVRPFEEVADLARVPGIGPRTIAGLDGWVHAGRAGGGAILGEQGGLGCARGS
jgi:competence ComEA-like helix-hairpin-helix protein